MARRELSALRDEDRARRDPMSRYPYLLDFLGLQDVYGERDLEADILRDLDAFILEPGSGFAFVARQERITVDNQDYCLSLLFYHRELLRMVAIEFKMGAFQAPDQGQMELDRRWLERHEMEPGEEPPLGLILCADRSDEHVELPQLDRSGIQVAAYLTDLPPKKVLERQLHDSGLRAKARLGAPAKADMVKGMTSLASKAGACRHPERNHCRAEDRRFQASLSAVHRLGNPALPALIPVRAVAE